MASNRATLKRYLLVLETVQQKQNCTKSDILRTLENNDFKPSVRTFRRILEELRDEFGIEIICDRKTNTYHIDPANHSNIDVVLRFLYISEHADFVISTLRDYKSISKQILLSKNYNPQGFEYLPRIIEAIRDKIQTSIKHQKHGAAESKEYILEPYYIKEYLNVWYLIAYIPTINDFRTFGIDRIVEIKLLTNKFTKLKDDSLPYFDNAVGVNFGEYSSIPEDVVFQTSEKAASYIRAKPIHHSQVEMDENTFKIFVIPNYELQQQLLAHGKHLTVIQPASLKEDIKKTLQEALLNY